MKIEKILNLISYRISGGSKLYLLKELGEIRLIEFEAIGSDMTCGTIETLRDEVLRLTVTFPSGNGCYRWTESKYAKAYKDEAKKRNYEDNQAWDNVLYTEILYEDEMLEKISAICEKRPYDKKVRREISIDEDVLNEFILRAEKENITVEKLTSNIIDKNKSKLIGR
jgi:hypothetical protein